MKSFIKAYTATLSLLLLLPPLCMLLFGAPSGSVHAAAPPMGDWTVSSAETESNKDITLTGHLVVAMGGVLTLDKVNLKMNCSYNAQFNITVQAGGKLIMKNSTVAPVQYLQQYRYNFEVQLGGQAEIYDSDLVAIGEGNYTKPQTMGLFIDSTNVKIINDRFTRANIFYMAAAIIVGPMASPRIEGNDISGVYPTGIIFMMGSKSLVKNNTIKNNGIGLSCFLSSPDIEGNEFNANLVSIQFTQCQPVLRGNTFRGSIFNALGAESSTITMDNDIFIDNAADMSLNTTSLTARRINASGSASGISIDHSGSSEATIENSSLVVDGASALTINDSTVNLLNTKFDQTKVSIPTDTGDLHVSWFLNVSVSYASGARAPMAVISVQDINNKTVVQAPADSNGELNWVKVEQYYQVGSNRTDLTPHEIKATVGSFAGNTSVVIDTTKTMDVVLDDLLPILNINYPLEGFITNRSTITFSGNASDNGKIILVEFKVPGESWTATNGLEEWNFTASLHDGTSQVAVRATDDSKNQVLAIVNISVDTQNPTLVVIRPVDGSLTNRTQVFLEGKSEPGAEVWYLTPNEGLKVPLETDNKGNFNSLLNLSEGKNKINIFSADKAGNQVMRVVNVELDTKAPFLYVTVPAANLITNSSKVTVSGRTEPNGNASITINNLPVLVTTNGTFAHDMYLSDGTITVRIVARDLAGNSAFLERLVTVDTTMPLIEIDAPDDNFITNITLISIKGRAQAQMLKIGQIEADVMPDPEAGWYDFNELYPLKEGLNNITVTAQDAAGNRATATVHVTLDTISPSLNISEPMNNADTTSLQVNIVGLTEPGARVTVNGQPIGDTDGSFSVPFDLQMGKNIISIKATDAAGNTIAVQLTITRIKKTSPGANVADSAVPLMLILILLCIAVFVLAYNHAKSDDKGNAKGSITEDNEIIPKKGKGRTIKGKASKASAYKKVDEEE